MKPLIINTLVISLFWFVIFRKEMRAVWKELKRLKELERREREDIESLREEDE